MESKSSPKGTLLIDAVDFDYADFAKGFLEKTGHPVLVCHGPSPATLCPIIATGHCPMAEEAHGLLFLFDLDRPQHRAILRQYQNLLRPDMPLRVMVRPGQAEHYADLLTNVEVWSTEPTAGQLDAFAAEVEAADRE